MKDARTRKPRGRFLGKPIPRTLKIQWNTRSLPREIYKFARVRAAELETTADAVMQDFIRRGYREVKGLMAAQFDAMGENDGTQNLSE